MLARLAQTWVLIHLLTLPTNISGCGMNFVPNTNNTVGDITWSSTEDCVTCILNSIQLQNTNFSTGQTIDKSQLFSTVCVYNSPENKFMKNAIANCRNIASRTWRVFLYYYPFPMWEALTQIDQCECQSRCKFLDEEMDFLLLRYEPQTTNPHTIMTKNGCVSLCINGLFSLPGYQNTLALQTSSEMLNESIQAQQITFYFNGCPLFDYYKAITLVMGDWEPNFNSPYNYFWTKRYFKKYENVVKELGFNTINDMVFKNQNCETESYFYLMIKNCYETVTNREPRCYYAKRTNVNDPSGAPFPNLPIGSYGEAMESYYWMNDLDRCFFKAQEEAYAPDVYVTTDYVLFESNHNYLSNVSESECECFTKYHYEYSRVIGKTDYQSISPFLFAYYTAPVTDHLFGYPGFAYFNSTINPMNLQCRNSKCSLYKDGANIFLYPNQYFEFKNATDCLKTPNTDNLVEFTVEEHVKTIECNINAPINKCLKFNSAQVVSLAVNQESWTCLINKVNQSHSGILSSFSYVFGDCPSNDCSKCKCASKSTTTMVCYKDNLNQYTLTSEYTFCSLYESNPGYAIVPDSNCSVTQGSTCAQTTCQSLTGIQNCNNDSKICVGDAETFAFMTINEYCSSPVRSLLTITQSSSDWEKCCQDNICLQLGLQECSAQHLICNKRDATSALISIQSYCQINFSTSYQAQPVDLDLVSCCAVEAVQRLNISSKALDQLVCILDSTYQSVSLATFCDKRINNAIQLNSLLPSSSCSCQNPDYAQLNSHECCVLSQCSSSDYQACLNSELCVNYEGDILKMSLQQFCNIKTDSSKQISISTSCETCASSMYRSANKYQCCLRDHCSDINDTNCKLQLLCLKSGNELTPAFATLEGYCQLFASQSPIEFFANSACEKCTDLIYRTTNAYKCCFEETCGSSSNCTNSTSICTQNNGHFSTMILEDYCNVVISGTTIQRELDTGKCCEQDCRARAAANSQTYCDLQNVLRTWEHYCIQKCTTPDLIMQPCASRAVCTVNADCNLPPNCSQTHSYIFWNTTAQAYQLYANACDLFSQNLTPENSNVFECPSFGASLEDCVRAFEAFTYNKNPHVILKGCPLLEFFVSESALLTAHPQLQQANYTDLVYKCPKPTALATAKTECLASFCVSFEYAKIITFFNNTFLTFESACSYTLDNRSLNITTTICCGSMSDADCNNSLKLQLCNSKSDIPAWNYQNGTINYFSKACLAELQGGLVGLQICNKTSSFSCEQQYQLFRCSVYPLGNGLILYGGQYIYNDTCVLKVLYPNTYIFPCIGLDKSECIKSFKKYQCVNQCKNYSYNPVCTTLGVFGNKCLAECSKAVVLNLCSSYPTNSTCTNNCDRENCYRLASKQVSRVCASDGVVYQNSDIAQCEDTNIVFRCDTLNYPNSFVRDLKCYQECQKRWALTQCEKKCAPSRPVCDRASKKRYNSACHAQCNDVCAYSSCDSSSDDKSDRR